MPKNKPSKKQVTFGETFTGVCFQYENPDQSLIRFRDVAHGLSLCCRFAGQCRTFYSVASHSMLVLDLVKTQTNDVHTLRKALLHDASEAYIHDIAYGLKQTNAMISYRSLETAWNVAIEYALGIDIKRVDRALIKDADNHALELEAHALMHSKGKGWNTPKSRHFDVVDTCFDDEDMTPKAMETAFILAWDSLK